MDIKLDIHAKYKDTSVTVHTPSWTKEIESLLNQLQAQTNTKKLAGVLRDQTILLDPNEVDYVYAEARKVFAVFDGESIELNMKLYDAERLLTSYRFTRFSKSVIGNVNRLERFELSFNGNLCVFFSSGAKEYVSRKYVKEMKQQLLMEVEDR
ncbi:LytTR family DNA-binding domain-containing protein [Pontibacillus salicampi]|uniref:LytTR family DNA-binding domain-containing protein n=1 Tax=Pontibacillus salicampi TaxID=1449801 RepID=A0ABV6LRP6_9BACI